MLTHYVDPKNVEMLKSAKKCLGKDMLLKSKFQFCFCSVLRLKLLNTVAARISKNCLIFNNINSKDMFFFQFLSGQAVVSGERQRVRKLIFFQINLSKLALLK